MAFNDPPPEGILDITMGGDFDMAMPFATSTTGLALSVTEHNGAIMTTLGFGQDSVVDISAGGGVVIENETPFATLTNIFSARSFDGVLWATTNLFMGGEWQVHDITAGGMLGSPMPFASATTADGAYGLLVVRGCGDSIAQMPEDCDDGAESADCNADCTTSMCGDMVLNMTAGEGLRRWHGVGDLQQRLHHGDVRRRRRQRHGGRDLRRWR